MNIKLIKGNDYVIVESGSVGEKRWTEKGYKPERSEEEADKPDTKGTGSVKNPEQGKENPDTAKVKPEQTGSDDKSGSKATDGNDKN